MESDSIEKQREGETLCASPYTKLFDVFHRSGLRVRGRLADEGYGDYVYLNIDNEGNIEDADEMKNGIEQFFDNDSDDELW